LYCFPIFITNNIIQCKWLFQTNKRARHGRDRMAVDFTTACDIGAYHH
jgi:hypothetical protein